MGELERKRDRAEKIAKAYELHLKGWTQEAIGGELGCNRDTARKWIREHIATQDVDTFDTQKMVAINRMERVIEEGFKILQAVPPTSLAGSNALREIINAQKEISRVSGLHISQLHVQNMPSVTLFQHVTEAGFEFPTGEELEEDEVYEPRPEDISEPH